MKQKTNNDIPSQVYHTDRQERIHAVRADLDKHIQALAEEMRHGKSDRLIAYLNFASRFHNYSVGNQLLIWSQMPDATFVAGIRRWNELGRRVLKGQRGLMIFAPIRYRKDSSKTTQMDGHDVADINEERETTTFRAVYVWDVSQTDGESVPQLLHATGDVRALLPVVSDVILRRGIELVAVDEHNSHLLPPGAEGVSRGGTIAVRANLPKPEIFRVLCHELAHELLHHGGQERPSKQIRETEADAVAYVCCHHFGIKCDSSDYLLLYDSSPDVLMSRLETVRSAAASIIGDIEAGLSTEPLPQPQDRRVVAMHSNQHATA